MDEDEKVTVGCWSFSYTFVHSLVLVFLTSFFCVCVSLTCTVSILTFPFCLNFFSFSGTINYQSLFCWSRKEVLHPRPFFTSLNERLIVSVFLFDLIASIILSVFLLYPINQSIIKSSSLRISFGLSIQKFYVEGETWSRQAAKNKQCFFSQPIIPLTLWSECDLYSWLNTAWGKPKQRAVYTEPHDIWPLWTSAFTTCLWFL